MTPLRTKLMKLLAVTAISMLFSGAALAKNAITDSGVSQAVPLKTYTDLQIEAIYGSECMCSESLDSVDGILMNDLWVTVGNRACPGPDGSNINASGQLRVTFFNMSANRLENRMVPFSINKNSRALIKIQGGPLLIKKSVGITASINRIDGNTLDCNPANNSKTVKQCLLPPLY